MSKMDKEHIFGHIIKREFITTAAAHILPGIFVLKIGKPFPGLYKNLVIRNIPEFYFLVLNESYPPESILNASGEINQKCDHRFNAVAGEISISGITYPVIRIKNIREKDCISELQSRFQEKGFRFNTRPEPIQSVGMVKIIKYFSLVEVKEGVYFDRMVQELGYFEIPRSMEWEVFEEMTNRIRVNVALGAFDAAMGVFYMGGREVNIIRIFNPVRSARNLTLIQDQYHVEMCNPEMMNTL
jgi:hypothetical protein